MKSASPLLLVIGAFGLCACTVYRNRSAATPNGNYSEQLVVQGPGGTVSTHGSDGASMVADNQQTARDLATAAAGVAGVIGDFKTTQSNNKLTGIKDTNATGLAGKKVDADTAIKLGKQKPIITTPPQVVTFPD